MKKILKVLGLVLLGLVVVLVLALAGLYAYGINRLNRVYTVPSEPISVPTDAASISGGEHLVSVHCAGCHGANLEGTTVFENPMLGTINAPTIAGAHGKYGTVLSDSELVRAIRHGVGIDKKPLRVMPSGSYYYFNDQDLGQIIAYVKSVKPPAQSITPSRLTVLGIALSSTGAFGPLLDAESIDHTGPRPAAVEPGQTVAYGDYKVKVGECRICHGPQLSGGKDPNPDAPPAPNLTPGGDLGAWSETEFIQTLRTGVTPGGRKLSEFMPWLFYGKMSDLELKAVYLYLKSLPALETTK